jgi:hypothetical protein
MPKILQLRGEFSSRRHSSNGFSKPKLPIGKSVDISHVEKLAKQLQSVAEYWEQNRALDGALVFVSYRSIIAKSNRLRALLMQQTGASEKLIRGAKFGWSNNHQFHIFTYFVSLENIEKSICILKEIVRYFKNLHKQEITQDDIDRIGLYGVNSTYGVSKTAVTKAIVDCYYVNSFKIEEYREPIVENSIISIYDTGIETKQLLEKFDIHILDNRIIGKTTLNLFVDEIAKLQDKAPYLIAMQVRDFSEINREEILNDEEISSDSYINLPSPSNEPIIGVIDTHFNSNVYFNEWVEYENRLDPSIELEADDYRHGTAVTSIIVDGPRANPRLDDGCGRFRVKHFGVAKAHGFSSFALLRMIQSIVAENRGIKVWNLSLGAIKEIPINFISPEGAELDRIQTEYDVIFVVAGTNDESCSRIKRIGAPADSINSVVVNSVDMNCDAASYTRIGPVLSFFNKPDVSYFGGDGTRSEGQIAVCRDDLGVHYVVGTSYAAPWISRKLAYLIHIVGVDRNTAKALIIDSAAGWSRSDDVSHTKGYGVVPVQIKDIVESENDEIRFILTGHIRDYYTYSYQLPVPVVQNRHPYWARATLVYFPECNRNQGVDYTSTEIDLQFGRIKCDNNDPSKIFIESINNNSQSDEITQYIHEEEARAQYRKWDNIKHIADTPNSRTRRPRKVYINGLWGVKVTTKERIGGHRSYGMPFSVVITLKAMDGMNRIQTFIDSCHAYNWVVNTIDIEQAVEVHNQSEVEIEFDD